VGPNATNILGTGKYISISYSLTQRWEGTGQQWEGNLEITKILQLCENEQLIIKSTFFDLVFCESARLRHLRSAGGEQ
jgi:hypothetical protein